MARRYTLDTKIDALNQLDQCDGDLLRTSDTLDIPARTLRNWRNQEDDLRDAYNAKQRRHLRRLKADLQTNMLERGLAIVARMNDETLDNAPLNQLTSALGSLVNHALKLEEVIDETDEQEEKERVIRVEYLYDGSVHKTPPWARERTGESGEIQDSRLRETLGKNGTGEDDGSGQRIHRWEAGLVARPELHDGESTMEGIEDDRELQDWYHD